MKLFERYAKVRRIACHEFRRSDRQGLVTNHAQAICSRLPVRDLLDFSITPARAGNDLRKAQALRSGFCKRRKNLFAIAVLERFKKWRHGRIGALVTRRVYIESRAAADRYDRRKLTQDEPVARQQKNRLIEAQLGQRRLSRSQFAASDQDDVSNRFRCSLMKMYACPILQWPRRREKRDARVETFRRLEYGRWAEDHPALNFVALDSSQIHSGALTGQRVSNCSTP